MKYRDFGKTDFKPSALGFGAMRLPSNPMDDYDNPDEEKGIEMIRYAIDQGVNYVDTAYPYHAEKSEVIVGKALKEGYREKVRVATKMPCWLVESFEDFDRLLNIQLERLQVDHIDYYLLHAIWQERWDKMKELNVFDWAEKAKADGRIGELGFSFHDDYELFAEVIDSYNKWGICLIQYNFLDENVQAGTRGLKYAADKGIPVVIMEPLLGGTLANPPAHIQKIWDQAGKNPADVALRWLWNKPEVSLVLSGMRSMEDLNANLQSADRSGVGKLTEEEAELVKRVQDEYKKLNSVPCTKCRYCMPCPQGVDIPRNFELYNEGQINIHLSRPLYNFHMKDSEKAANCTSCKLCEDKCPQQIKISELMPKIDKELAVK
ncbi:MAG: aldo/keto reductase [Halanaerobiales bacterium]